MTTIQIRLLSWAGVMAILVATHLYSFSLGSNKVQTEWDKAKIAYQVNLQKEQLKTKELESTVSQQSVVISDSLVQLKEEYEIANRNANAEHASRLQQSAARADLYKRQAQGAASEQERLASHAAELDRTLVEGKELAGELRRTLELREQEIRLLAEQIHNDRLLLD